MASVPAAVISAAKAAQVATGIPASVSIAQWAVESAWGTRCTGTFNYFGIKAVAGQPYTVCQTHEVVDGKSVLIHAAFANYASLDAAFTAHAQLLDDARFAEARACLPDAVAFVDKLAPIYATDPNYARVLTEIITEHDLAQYDQETVA